MKTVAFVCTRNSSRSQMAEGWAKYFARGLLASYSAGTNPDPNVNPLAVQVMTETGVDIASFHTKPIQEIPGQFDILITMGCGVKCPYFPSKYREDWGIEDPAGKPIDAFRKARDEIKAKVMALIGRVNRGEL